MCFDYEFDHTIVFEWKKIELLQDIELRYVKFNEINLIMWNNTCNYKCKTLVYLILKFSYCYYVYRDYNISFGRVTQLIQREYLNKN